MFKHDAPFRLTDTPLNLATLSTITRLCAEAMEYAQHDEMSESSHALDQALEQLRTLPNQDNQYEES